MLPLARATTTPDGPLNCPLPEPAIPARHVPVQTSNFSAPSLTPKPTASTNEPLELNFSKRLFMLSATHTLPLESSATAVGNENCPLPEPAAPNWNPKAGLPKGSLKRIARPWRSRSIDVVYSALLPPDAFPRGATDETSRESPSYVHVRLSPSGSI